MQPRSQFLNLRSALLGTVLVVAAAEVSGQIAWAQSAKPLSEAQQLALERGMQDLQQALDQMPEPRPREWSDAGIFAKGLAWGLRYDREFTPADIALLEQAVRRGNERLEALRGNSASSTSSRGKRALGYVSRVDGSVQPYGVIIPAKYDAATPIRLDVVLHGSTRPVGMSELRFMARFDEADVQSSTPPDRPFIELHPLGRVENCYRWSGETDVFEAIDDVCRRYNIDRDRIVLRGMSMGASGTWHLGLKHPHHFVALGPYCGYVDTNRFSETPVANFVRIAELPEYQELALHMLDSIDYAANAGIVPAIACMGEKDVFFQAHVLMCQAMQCEGLTMTNLISPGTGHVIDPVIHAEQLRRIGEIAAAGRRRPAELRFVTWTLKYNRCHWLEVLQLDRHYARAEFSARLKDEVLEVDEPRNISRFAVNLADLPAAAASIRVGTAALPIPQESKRVVVDRRDGRWEIDARPDQETKTLKRPGLQGPIDDALTGPFLCVRGTGRPWNPGVQEYAEASLRRFSEEWEHYFRGKLPVKDDFAVTAGDVKSRHLILFGDPGSNSWIAKVLPQLPLEWSQNSLRLGGNDYPSSRHVPALVAPNPLPGAGEHYVVLNSGHTFHESELAKLNYLLFPRWGDWAVIQIDPAQPVGNTWDDQVLRAGFFDERWR